MTDLDAIMGEPLVSPEQARQYLNAIRLPFTDHDEFTDGLARAVVALDERGGKLLDLLTRGERHLTEALTLLDDDSNPEAAAALETLAKRTWPSLRAALGGDHE